MSNESSTARRDDSDGRPARRDRGPIVRLDRAVDWLSARREPVVHAAGAVALTAVALTTTIGIVRNLPYRPVAVPETVRALAVGGTPVVVALALVTLALASQRDTVRVGLLFAGVFGLLAAVSESATVPAIAAVVGGGGLALLGGLGRPATYREGRRVAITIAILAGVTVSLGSTAGVIGAGFRGPGGVLALVGLAALGVRSEGDWIALVAGIFAFAVVVYASLARPFVVGSGLLVGFAVVDVPHLLAALALGGGTTAAVAGLRRREYGLAIGAGLLLFAGVPATVPRATAVVLGATLALVSVGRIVGDDSNRRDPKGEPA